MNTPNSASQKPIHTEPFKVLNPTRWIPLIVGLGSILFSLILTTILGVEKGGIASVPILGVAIGGVILFFLFPKRTKKINIYWNGLEVHGKNGLESELQFGPPLKPRNDRKFYYLKTEEGDEFKVPRGQDQKVQGLLELILKHNSTIPASIWSLFSMKNEVSTGQELGRIFLDSDEKPLFLDRGIIISHLEMKYYYPISTTTPIVQPRTPGSVSAYMAPGQFNPVPNFDPNPAQLPLRALIQAILAANLPLEGKTQYLNLLAEEHGGALVQPGEAPNTFTGEAAGYSVQIQP